MQALARLQTPRLGTMRPGELIQLSNHEETKGVKKVWFASEE
jgi:hypothetical protein